MENFDNKRLADVASKWWADKLDGTAKQDFGITQETLDEYMNLFCAGKKLSVELFNKIAQENALKKAVPEFLRMRFRKVLRTYIEKELNERGFAGLSVELEAEGMLGLVAYICNIEHGQFSVFPPFTEMFIEKGRIEVKYGKSERNYQEIFNLNKQKQNNDFIK